MRVSKIELTIKGELAPLAPELTVKMAVSRLVVSGFMKETIVRPGLSRFVV